jgi:16S rRNA (guanine527-N7)-methyltransferase
MRERVESWRPVSSFAVVITRAFSDIAEFVRLSAHLLATGGVLAAMKGVYPYEEIAQMPGGFRVDKVVTLHVPEIEGARHLVLIRTI